MTDTVRDHPRTPGSYSRRATSLAALALLAVFFVLGFVSARHKSGTYDEKGHLSYGRQILETGSFKRTILRHNSKIPASALNALPAWAARQAGWEIPEGRHLRYNRLPTLFLGVLLGWLVFAWAREAHGDRAGLVAVALFAFSPNLLAHSRLITSDVATSLGVFAACYAFWRFTVRPGRGRLLVSGIALGLALTTKVSSLLLLPSFALLAAILLFRRRGWPRYRVAREEDVGPGRGALRAAVDLVVIFAVALLAINAVYLFEGSFTPLAEYELLSRRMSSLAEIAVLGVVPVPLPYGYVQGVDMIAMTTDRDRWTYCLGEYRPRGFPHYFLVGLLTKTTVGFLALLAVALAMWLISFLPRRQTAPGRDNEGAVDLFLLLPAAVWFGYLSFLFHFHIGFRYALPILPLLFVFVSGLVARWPTRSLPGVGVVLAVVLHAASSLAVHPHYLAYFNEPSGGPIAGWRYLIDSNIDWGQDRGWARRVYPTESEVPVIAYPKGPTAGRLMVNVNTLVGLKPHEAKRYAWLRENFEPVDHVGYSFLVYDVTEEDLDRLGFR